jgi:hypothetical protein
MQRRCATLSVVRTHVAPPLPCLVQLYLRRARKFPNSQLITAVNNFELLGIGVDERVHRHFWSVENVASRTPKVIIEDKDASVLQQGPRQTRIQEDVPCDVRPVYVDKVKVRLTGECCQGGVGRLLNFCYHHGICGFGPSDVAVEQRLCAEHLSVRMLFASLPRIHTDKLCVCIHHVLDSPDSASPLERADLKEPLSSR